MAQNIQLISLSSAMVEGVAVSTEGVLLDSAQAHLMQPDADALENGRLQQFGTLLAETGWQSSSYILVLPSDEVICRTLQFPFRDRRKIRQALMFELETELMEDVSTLVYDFVIEPDEDAGAKVHTYLIPQSTVQQVLELCQSLQMIPRQILFSAQALVQVDPPQAQEPFQLYLGLDQAFISHLSKQTVTAVRDFPFYLGLGWSGSPEEAIELLLQGEASAELTALQQAMEDELNLLLSDATQFMRLHAPGGQPKVQVVGFFAPLVQWEAATQRFMFEAGADWGQLMESRTFPGLMERLHANEGALLDRPVINFAPKGGRVLHWLREYRRPLAVLATLMVAWVTIGIVNFSLLLSSYDTQAQQAENALMTLVKRRFPTETTVTGGMRRLEAEVGQYRSEAANSERFQAYHYDALKLLQAISSIFDKYEAMQLTSITSTGDRLVLSGTTESYNDSEAMKLEVEALPMLEGFEALLTHTKTNNGISFRLSASQGEGP